MRASGPRSARCRAPAVIATSVPVDLRDLASPDPPIDPRLDPTDPASVRTAELPVPVKPVSSADARRTVAAAEPPLDPEAFAVVRVVVKVL
jgi:hypothetical protein